MNKTVALLTAGLIAVVAGANYVYRAATEEVVTITVNEKQRECTSSKTNECRYVIYTENEVFENVDTWYYLKFNSSDFYNQLKVGQTYTVKVNGIRWGFLSMYRNIVEIR